MKRLNVYIDGFNLYFGMVNSGLSSCKWLDVQSLAMNIKSDSHILNETKYFTSRISNNPDKQKRQNIYLEALQTTSISIMYGQFRNQPMKCTQCSYFWYDSKEKMTDVNIATSMMTDAFTDNFDVAFLISGDSDLVPPVAAIRSLFPQKEIWVVLPPGRESNALKKVASGSFVLGKKKLQQSQLPNEVTSKYGMVLKKPPSWC
ncbi:MAG: hypothetical protein BGO55_12060 [Sphingobacteriales bacterium 50-39]|nr:NYN domain-containing protein [Sphingobacteriales bacterium]OJW54417.1 MAG: hypothetical protein BGO55_12060 [Sphingobacteriales bacterium 50-39]